MIEISGDNKHSDGVSILQLANGSIELTKSLFSVSTGESECTQTINTVVNSHGKKKKLKSLSIDYKVFLSLYSESNLNLNLQKLPCSVAVRPVLRLFCKGLGLVMVSPSFFLGLGRQDQLRPTRTTNGIFNCSWDFNENVNHSESPLLSVWRSCCYWYNESQTSVNRRPIRKG